VTRVNIKKSKGSRMKKKKNIVVFMTDQQNADTIKENSLARTPNIDA